MPLYEYHCEACGRRFELIRKFSDPPLEKCPHCGGTVRKLFSSPAIQFKGSGFYITDYAKKDQGSAAGGESKADAAAAMKEAGEKADKGEKSGEKTEAPKKTETSGKADKIEKVANSEKSEKPAAKSE
jgi:putative FmdB family regulatory protein